MVRAVAQASLFMVALIIGVLLIGQLRSQAPAIELSSLSAQELASLIETLSAGNADLSDGLDELRDQIREYERAEIEGRSKLELTDEDVQRFRAFAGLSAVEGQGIVMDMEGDFDPAALNDLIQELRSAGAEAIAIDDIRITASSVAERGTGAIEIDGVPLGPTVRVHAIGSPDGLTAAMTRPGGILSLLERSIGVQFTIASQTHMTVPATGRDLAPQVAQPVE